MLYIFFSDVSGTQTFFFKAFLQIANLPYSKKRGLYPNHYFIKMQRHNFDKRRNNKSSILSGALATAHLIS